jgi:conjugative transfer signal peptidase TraF
MSPDARARQRRTTRRVVMVCGVLLTIAGAGAAAGFRLVVTPSMPRGLYRQVTLHGDPQRHDTVAVCLPPAPARLARERGYVAAGLACPGGVQTVTKVVLALAFDTVLVTREALIIGGARLPNSRQYPRDGKGRPLPQSPLGTHVVPAGHVWIGSTYDSRSFDSRYVGPVPFSAVVGRERRVWTEALDDH